MLELGEHEALLLGVLGVGVGREARVEREEAPIRLAPDMLLSINVTATTASMSSTVPCTISRACAIATRTRLSSSRIVVLAAAPGTCSSASRCAR